MKMFKIIAVHLGFHLFWCVLWIGSLLGAFWLIPFVSLYQTFVLGLLGILSRTSVFTMVGGVFVFALTGYISGLLIIRMNPRSLFRASIASLAGCVMLLIVMSFGTLLMISTGIRTTHYNTEDISSPDDIGVWLKIAYAAHDRRVPPYIVGESAIIPLKLVEPLLKSLNADLSLAANQYKYLNLTEEVWQGVRAKHMAQIPLAWCDYGSNNAVVITIDLNADSITTTNMYKGDVRTVVESITGVKY